MAPLVSPTQGALLPLQPNGKAKSDGLKEKEKDSSGLRGQGSICPTYLLTLILSTFSQTSLKL